MSKTRDLRDANETISTFFRSQDSLLSSGGSSSSSQKNFESPRPKFPRGGADETFGDPEEDFALPGTGFGKPTPPLARNGTKFEDLYLQTQRKYDEV